MDKILFFGYGANKNQSKIFQVTGNSPKGIGAVVEGYRLAFQSLGQIPEPARSILKDNWGSEFRAYTLKKEEGIVGGVIWEISKEDFQKIKEWEFIGVWRELIEVEVLTSDGRKLQAFTEKAPDIHPVSGLIDGLTYNEYEFMDLTEKENEQKLKYYNDKQISEIRVALKKLSGKK